MMLEPGGRGEPGGPPQKKKIGRPVNSIPTGGGHIIPTYYYWHPQIFSPSGITEMYLPKVGGDKSPLSLYFPTGLMGRTTDNNSKFVS